jgi:hypothetical protein
MVQSLCACRLKPIWNLAKSICKRIFQELATTSTRCRLVQDRSQKRSYHRHLGAAASSPLLGQGLEWVGGGPREAPATKSGAQVWRWAVCKMYRIRAVAGIGSACGVGANPTPDLREPARAAPRTRKYRRAARLGCNGAQRSPGVRQQ